MGARYVFWCPCYISCSWIITSSHRQKGDVQILIQLTSIECLLCARGCQALIFHIPVIGKDARWEEAQVVLTPSHNFSAVWAPFLGLLWSRPPLRNGAVSLLFYISLHIVSGAGFCPLRTSAGILQVLCWLSVTYGISSGPILPSFSLPCLPPYDQTTQIYSQFSNNASFSSHICALPMLFLLGNCLLFLLHWINSYSSF